MKRIRTERRISFPPAAVWAVLVDFRRYQDWNPLNVWADGDAILGERVPMRFVDAGGGKGKIISQTVTITALEPERRLEWIGRIPLLFTGRHMFELQPEGEGTRLLHGEDLSGLVPALFPAERIARQRAAYEAMNAALEQRVAEIAGFAAAPQRLQAAMVPRDGIEPPTP